VIFRYDGKYHPTLHPNVFYAMLRSQTSSLVVSATLGFNYTFEERSWKTVTKKKMLEGSSSTMLGASKELIPSDNDDNDDKPDNKRSWRDEIWSWTHRHPKHTDDLVVTRDTSSYNKRDSVNINTIFRWDIR